MKFYATFCDSSVLPKINQTSAVWENAKKMKGRFVRPYLLKRIFLKSFKTHRLFRLFHI